MKKGDSAPRWTSADDQYLRDSYPSRSAKEMALQLGRGVGAIRSRCSLLGLKGKSRAWGEGDEQAIRDWVLSKREQDLDLDGLAASLGRTKASVACKLSGMGLGERQRKRVKRINGLVPSAAAKLKYASLADFRSRLPEIRRETIIKYGHPRGAVGLRHTDTVKQQIAEANRRRWESTTPEQLAAQVEKRNATNVERYGTGNPAMLLVSNPYSRAKRGRREDLGDRYFRSRWEANYARYLNLLIVQGKIAAWEYEPQTFVFHGVTRGELTYKPDFKVVEHDGTYAWHEVKGWMDAKSKAKLKRMAEFYPDETIIVIGRPEYLAIREWSGMIAGWEDGKD